MPGHPGLLSASSPAGTGSLGLPAGLPAASLLWAALAAAVVAPVSPATGVTAL